MMKNILKVVKRLKYIPGGILFNMINMINSGARDLENCKRYPAANIDRGSSFSADTIIGKGVRVMEGAIINHTEIGNYTYLNRNVLVQNAVIGNYCSIAHDVNIGLGRHPVHLVSTSPLFYKKGNPLKFNIVSEDIMYDEYISINVGHDVWIGARALIMDGVSLGIGSVIAAGSVVTKDVPPYAIVGGVPAKVIKYRFDDNKISHLLKSEWWNLQPVEALKKMKEI
jgi:acetyltransferase-like isoleucine patch superfamily enzyme